MQVFTSITLRRGSWGEGAQHRQRLGNLPAFRLDQIEQFGRRAAVGVRGFVGIDCFQVVNRVFEVFRLAGQFAGFPVFSSFMVPLFKLHFAIRHVEQCEVLYSLNSTIPMLDHVAFGRHAPNVVTFPN